MIKQKVVITHSKNNAGDLQNDLDDGWIVKMVNPLPACPGYVSINEYILEKNTEPTPEELKKLKEEYDKGYAAGIERMDPQLKEAYDYISEQNEKIINLTANQKNKEEIIDANE